MFRDTPWPTPTTAAATTTQSCSTLDLLHRKPVEDEARVGIEFTYVTKPDGSQDTMLASRSAGYDGKVWINGNQFCGLWIGHLVAARIYSRGIAS